jgi:uncharacterized membrane protein
VSARTQLLASGAVGRLAGLVVALLAPPSLGALIAWDVAAVVYLAWGWFTIWPLDAEHTARRADHQDPTRATADSCC